MKTTTTESLARRILLIEDDTSLQETMQLFLQMEGFKVEVASSLKQTESRLQEKDYDLLVLDLGLGKDDGLEWLQRKRQDLGDSGIVIVTGCSEVESRVAAMRCGADLYFIKPVVLQELAASLNNLARRIRHGRGATETAPLLKMPAWQLNTTIWQLTSPQNQSISLTASELALMLILAKEPGSVASKKRIVEALGHSLDSYDFRRLEVLVRRLRNKYRNAYEEDLPLMTARGQGYSFSAGLVQI